MRFFADRNLPESVAKALEQAGYEVERFREGTPTDAPGTLVAAMSEADGAILVTMDADFKSIASRIGSGGIRYGKLSLVRFEKCRESRAAERLKAALSLT
jgi:predicted nuclease of predicted toxin-antitoxin system